nr:hypothetical protein [Tanacetum cinerariifolium]
ALLLSYERDHACRAITAEYAASKESPFLCSAFGFEVEECSAATARQDGHALTSSVDYEFIDTMDASIRASESREMTTIREVNERVTDLAITQRQDTHELHIRDEEAQDDQALMRAQISILTRERRYFSFIASFYEREAVIARQAWSRS